MYVKKLILVLFTIVILNISQQTIYAESFNWEPVQRKTVDGNFQYIKYDSTYESVEVCLTDLEYHIQNNEADTHSNAFCIWGRSDFFVFVAYKGFDDFTSFQAGNKVYRNCDLKDDLRIGIIKMKLCYRLPN